MAFCNALKQMMELQCEEMSLPFIVWKWKCWCCRWNLCVISDAILCNSCSLTPYSTGWINPYAIRIQWQCRKFPHRSDRVIAYNSNEKSFVSISFFKKIWTKVNINGRLFLFRIRGWVECLIAIECASANGNNRFFIVHNRLIMTLKNLRIAFNLMFFFFFFLFHSHLGLFIYSFIALTRAQFK